VTAPSSWLAAVQAVEHDKGCPSFFSLAASRPHFAAYVGRCTCSRDARIAKGCEALLREADLGCACPACIDRALAAFSEASR
jgi:hypothetical protein